MGRRPTLEERVHADMQRGDLGLARQRLASHAASMGYSPGRMAHVAEVCIQMKDRCAAGRFWLLSEADGPEVEAAVAEFVRRSGTTAASVVSQVPRFARLATLSAYPPRVQERLDALGLSERIVLPVQADGGRQSARMPAYGHLLVGFVLVLLVVGVVAIVAGVAQFVRWLAGS